MEARKYKRTEPTERSTARFEGSLYFMRGDKVFSLEITAENKNSLIELFEALSHFPDTLMMLKSGDYTVDAHSIIGVYSIDSSKPIQLLLEKEPTDKIRQAVAKFASVKA